MTEGLLFAAVIGFSCRAFLRLYMEGDGFMAFEQIEVCIATSLFIATVAFAFIVTGAATGVLVVGTGMLVSKIVSLMFLPRHLEIAVAVMCFGLAMIALCRPG